MTKLHHLLLSATLIGAGSIALAARDREFLKMVLSKHGQEVVNRDGLIPLSASVASEWRKRLGIDKPSNRITFD